MSHSQKEELRYGFGKNWKRFLQGVTEKKVTLAESSLAKLLRCENLERKTFLDIGSGSGLFSLAALNLGAMSVRSFDFDSDSVDCGRFLQKQYDIPEERWVITQGSILDESFVETLPKSDVVYSWGVLHHTGSMWKAFELASRCVAPDGLLAIAIYNDQGIQSRIWTVIKQLYNRSIFFRIPLIIFFQLLFGMIGFVADVFFYRRNPLHRYRHYEDSARGMNRFTDLLDWLGGYPFEVAKPEEVFLYFVERGFQLVNLRTVGGGLGCNEYVFQRTIVLVDS